METNRMKVRITFTEPMLGTASANPELHEEFIASNAPDAPSLEEEIAAIGQCAVIEKGKTVFPRDENGAPMLWDYQVKGFFKGSCGFLRRVKGTEASKLKSYKKVIDGLLFVYPRRIRLDLHGQELGNCQRPLRAETMQGERVALANSETAPAGTTIECEIETYTDDLKKFVVEALDYGAKHGIGQWRNSGAGRFTWEEIE